MEKVQLTEEQLKDLSTKLAEGAVKEAMSEFRDEVKDIANEVFEAHQKSSQGGEGKEVSEHDEKELTVKFIKSLHRGNKSEIVETQKNFVELEGKSAQISKVADDELNIGTDSQGGYYVPAPILSRIITSAEKYGLARKLGLVIPMTSDTLDVPRVDTEAEFASIAEKASYGALNYEFGNTQLNATKYGGMVRPTEEFIADANIDVLDMLFMLFGRAAARTEDNIFLNGILGDANVNSLAMGSGDTAFADAVLDDFLDLQDQLEDGADENAVYVMHKNIWTNLRKIKVNAGTDDRYIIGYPEGGSKKMLWDTPVYTNGKMPGTSASAADTEFAIYGNLQNYILGDRKQMTMKILTERYADVGEVGVRVDERIAVGAAVPSDLAVLKTAAS